MSPTPCPQGGSRLHKIMTVTAECFSLNQLRTNASQMNKLKAKTNLAQNRTQEEEGKEKHSQDHPGYKMLEHHHRNHNGNQPKPITNPRNHLRQQWRTRQTKRQKNYQGIQNIQTITYKDTCYTQTGMYTCTDKTGMSRAVREQRQIAKNNKKLKIGTLYKNRMPDRPLHKNSAARNQRDTTNPRNICPTTHTQTADEE